MNIPINLEAYVLQYGKIPYGVDWDDCAVESISVALDWHNSKHLTSFTLEQCHSYDLEKLLGISTEEWERFEEEFYVSDKHFSMEPDHDFRKFVQLHRDIFDFHVITKRPPKHRAPLLQYINMHFHMNDFAGVHTIGKDHPSHAEIEKYHICQKFGIKYLADDSYRHVHLAAERLGVIGYLRERPWNSGITEIHEHVKRINDFDDLNRIIRNMRDAPHYYPNILTA